MKKIIHVITASAFLALCFSCDSDQLNGLLPEKQGDLLSPTDGSNEIPRYASPFQRLVFEDEFNGKDYADAKDQHCFDIKPVCTTNLGGFSAGTCPADVNDAQFKNLNKCNWSLWTGYSFWDQSRRSAYHPNQVEVLREGSTGFLRLNGKWNKKNSYNCGDATGTVNSKNVDCLFTFGGLDSSYDNEISQGRTFKFGRLEFRARISNHKNLYPALWTWGEASGNGNPHKFNGDWNKAVYAEIDILEAVNSAADKYEPFQTLHDWKCPPNQNNCNIWTSAKNLTLKRNDWHVYGAERELLKNGKIRVRFYIDDAYTLSITEGDIAKVGTTNIKDYFEIGDMPLNILISLASNYVGANGDAEYAKMDGMKMDVDWTRLYEN